MRISCRPSGSTRYYISFKFLIPHESERSHQRIVLAPILLNVYLGVGWRLMEPQIPGGRDFGGRDISTPKILAPFYILHASNEPGELSQWLYHDDSTINIVLDSIIIARQKRRDTLTRDRTQIGLLRRL